MSSRRPPPKPSRPPSSRGSLDSTRRTLAELPPLPVPPRREKFSSEPPTRQKNVTASVYQSLISVFDTMTPAQRMEFVDVAALYAGLDTKSRRDFVELLTLFPELGPDERAEIHALVEMLVTKSRPTP